MSSGISPDSEISELNKRVLAAFVDSESERNLRQLYEVVNPPSLAALEDSLRRLLRERRLAALYRVHSPFGDRDGLRDFQSLDEIPSVMEDESQDPPIEFRVGLSNIEVVFSPARE